MIKYEEPIRVLMVGDPIRTSDVAHIDVRSDFKYYFQTAPLLTWLPTKHGGWRSITKSSNAGSENADRLIPDNYLSSTNACIAVFSLFDPASFEGLKSRWIPEIRRYLPNVPILVAGLGVVDRPGNRDSTARTVSQQKARSIADAGKKIYYSEEPLGNVTTDEFGQPILSKSDIRDQ